MSALSSTFPEKLPAEVARCKSQLHALKCEHQAKRSSERLSIAVSALAATVWGIGSGVFPAAAPVLSGSFLAFGAVMTGLGKIDWLGNQQRQYKHSLRAKKQEYLEAICRYLDEKLPSGSSSTSATPLEAQDGIIIPYLISVYVQKRLEALYNYEGNLQDIRQWVYRLRSRCGYQPAAFSPINDWLDRLSAGLEELRAKARPMQQLVQKERDFCEALDEEFSKLRACEQTIIEAEVSIHKAAPSSSEEVRKTQSIFAKLRGQLDEKRASYQRQSAPEQRRLVDEHRTAVLAFAQKLKEQRALLQELLPIPMPKMPRVYSKAASAA